MAALLLRHPLEHLCGCRIALGEFFGEGHVDAAVLLLRGYRHGQDLAFGQIGETLHGERLRSLLE